MKLLLTGIHGFILFKLFTFSLALADVITIGDTSGVRGWIVSLGIANPITVGSLAVAGLWARPLRRRHGLPWTLALLPLAALSVLVIVPGLVELRWLWTTYLALVLFWAAWWAEHLTALARWAVQRWRRAKTQARAYLERFRPRSL